MTSIKNTLSLLSLTALLALGCATESDVDVDGELLELPADQAAALDAKADIPSIPFTVFSDSIGTRGAVETRRLFTTSADYRQYFGHAAPGVDFSRQWVVFYSAGNKTTGGHVASIQNISTISGDRTLTATTKLSSPGLGCFRTLATTRPYVLVKFARPRPTALPVRYYRNDLSVPCRAPTLSGFSSRCSQILCIDGLVCSDASGTAGCYEPGFPLNGDPGLVVTIPSQFPRCEGLVACPVGLWCMNLESGASCVRPSWACSQCSLRDTCTQTPDYGIACTPKIRVPGVN